MCSYLPSDIDAIPSIRSVDITPAIISLGENLGQRAAVTVNFRDHKHIFDDRELQQRHVLGQVPGALRSQAARAWRCG